MIDSGAITLDDETLPAFDGFMKEGLTPYFKEKKEPIKVEIIQTIRKLIEVYREQLLTGIIDPADLHIQGTRQTFIPVIVEELVKYLAEYFENVREQAQLALLYIV